MKHPENLSATSDAVEALGIDRGRIEHSPRGFNVAGNIYWDACKQLASARAIMQKFVDKVDRGEARSTVTYAEMKQWMEEE